MDSGWVCGACKSINPLRSDRCYSCRGRRAETEDTRFGSGQPSDTPAAVRDRSFETTYPGASVWVVSPASTPVAALEAVQREVAKEIERFDPDSVKAWRALDPEAQMWAAGSFILVGLAVAMADGKVEPGELERAFLKTDEIAAKTRSCVVNQALAIMSDRGLIETVMSAALPSPEPAIRASREALGKVPEADRCRVTVALYVMAWSAITEAIGGPPTPETIELRQLLGIIVRLGLDLEGAAAWVKQHGP
jgi:hypothetical protein